MVEHHKVMPSRCPKCGSLNDAATHCEPPFTAKPKPGDVGVCFKCGTPWIFDHEMQFREPTKKERKQLERNPYVQRASSLIFQRRN